MMSDIDEKELEIKIELCKFLGIIPLFIVRMAPGRYIDVVKKAGGFTLIFKYQLYPTNYRELTKRMRQELKLPADCPRAIEQGTINRFEKWHVEKVKYM